MTRVMNIEGIEKATGKSQDKWIKFLERMRARDLSHTAIAQKVSEQEGVTNWWAQTIAVAYEQYIGRRRPGQTSGSGYFSAAIRQSGHRPRAPQPQIAEACRALARLLEAAPCDGSRTPIPARP
jgi:hypothetical protein